MKRACGLAALLAGMCWVSAVPAQRPRLPVPGVRAPVGPVAGFAVPGRRPGFSVYLGGGFGPACYAPYPFWGRSFTSVTVFFPPPPIVVAPPPVVALPPGEP